MANLPKISIVIPVYNVEEYITECLQSVTRQTYTGAIECILVDDCGKDKSIAIAEQLISTYKGTISFRILHHDHNRGLSAARNTGTEVATGEYIYYLDSDDYISDDCLSVLTEPLNECKFDMIIGNIEVVGECENNHALFEKRNKIIGNMAIFSSYANRMIYVMAWNKLCRLSFLRDNKIDFLEGQLHEDEMWTYKIMCKIEAISLVHKKSYYYRMRENAITNATNISYRNRALSYFETIKYMYENPYIVQTSYKRVTDFYVQLYMSLATASHNISLKQYLLVRRMYHPNNFSHRKISIQLHYNLRPIIGYFYLVIWIRIKSLVKNVKL